MEAGSTGLRPEDLDPPVDTNCFSLDYASAAILNNAAPLNMSSNTLSGSTENIFDSSDENFLENARAHRAVLRANDLYVGYIYAEDGVVADVTDLANYNFFVRHFNASKGLWNNPVNLSNISNTAVNVLEPRLIGMPGNGPGCTDPSNITNPEDCQNKNTVIAAWGTETNVYEHIGGSEKLDIYITRTTDSAAHWEPISSLASGPNAQGESQIKVTPDGNRIFSVWNETGPTGTNSMFSLGTPVTLFSDISVATNNIPTTVHAGSDFDIGYTVENHGPDSAYDINLDIVLPASVQLISADEFCLHDAGTITCQLGDMAANTSIPVNISVKSTIEASLTFAATIESDVLDDPDTSNNQNQSIVNATMASDVDVKTSSSTTSVDVGSHTNITYQLSNTGPSQAEAVILTLPLPAGASYISSAPDICAEASNEVSCDIGTLAAGDSTALTIELQITASGQTEIFAISSATTFDPDAANNQTSSVITGIPHADIAVLTSASRNKLKQGKQTTLKLALTNNGPQDATDAVMTINTPMGWAQHSLTITRGNCRVSGSSFICEIGDLEVGASSIINLVGTVDDVAVVTLSASGSATENDSDVTNNESSVSVIFTTNKTDIQQIFGCSLTNSNAPRTLFDPTLPILLLFSFYKIAIRRFIH